MNAPWMNGISDTLFVQLNGLSTWNQLSFKVKISFCSILEIIHNWLFLKIACATAGEAQKWMEAFDHAKQQVSDLFTKKVMTP